LRAIEDGLRQLLECTREVWLLKKEIENLEEKNNSLVQSHQGNTFLSTVTGFGIFM
jgi:FtsZ-binding cell division protein ZapB